MALKQLFKDIASAIRVKDGSEEKIKAIDFPKRILGIEVNTSGGDIYEGYYTPTGENRKKIWLQKSKNLYPVHLEIGAFYGTNNGGVAFDYSNYPIQKGKTYTFHTTFLKENTGFNTRLYITDVKFPTDTVDYQGFYYADFEGEHTFTAEKDGYFGLQIWKDNYEWIFENDVTPSKITEINRNYKFMLQEGSTFNEYEDYIETKLYILNENDEYEEM